MAQLVVVALASSAASAAAGTAASQQRDARGNMTIARGESDLYAVTHRAGLFGFLGHEHAITAEEWSADFCYDADSIEDSFIDVVVPTAALRIDTERGLELAGIESSPDPSTIADLQEEMLSPEFLGAERFPELRFVSIAVTHADRRPDDEGDLMVEGDLSIHGRTNRVAFPVEVERSQTGIFTFSAHVAFMMTNFGITPESTAGVVAVADEMDLYFTVVAQRTRQECE